MKSEHPKDEVLVEWAYGDGDVQAGAHLEACGHCRAKVERWRGVMGNLDAWKVEGGEAIAPRRSGWGALGKVAIAAALVVAGIGLGRSGGGGAVVDVEAVKREVAVELIAAFDERRQEDLEVMKLLLGRQDVELAAIRQDLETVAWNAEQRIGTAEEGILQLASLGLVPGERGEEPAGQH